MKIEPPPGSEMARAREYLGFRGERLRKIGRPWDVVEADLLLDDLQEALIGGLPTKEYLVMKKAGVLVTPREDRFWTRTNEPIKVGQLYEVLQNYLGHPELSCGTFDWLFLNGFVRHFVDDAERTDQSRFGASATYQWAWLLTYAFSSEDLRGFRPAHWQQNLLGFVAIPIRLVIWLALPVGAWVAWSKGYEAVAMGLAVAALLLILRRIALLPEMLLRHRDRQAMAAMTNGVQLLRASVSHEVQNPVELLHVVRQVRSVMPGVTLSPIDVVLARAVARDPAVLGFCLVNQELPLPVAGTDEEDLSDEENL